MRHVIWAITGFIGVIVMVNGFVNESVAAWLIGAGIFFGGFAWGNQQDEPPTKRRL